ncbi:MAG: GDSL-type esterase/lipase family protein [Vulcanimicrobiota bacterium]
MRNWLIWLMLTLPLLAVPLDRYENSIAAYEAADRVKAPPTGGTLFLGSSTFTLWGHDLENEFARFQALNRGFGGSTIPEIDHYLERICFPYRPRLVVFYAGTNDIAEGHTAEQVSSDFQHLTAHLRRGLPEARLAYVSMAMPPSRVQFERQYRAANLLIRDYCASGKQLDFIDVSELLLDQQGRPRAEYYREDQLHMRPTGYALWSPVLRRYLEQHL